MPTQVGIDISDIDSGIHIQIGGNGFDITEADLFDDSLDLVHAVENLRLAFLIGGYAELNSEEFKAKRIVTIKNGIFHLNGIELIDSETQRYAISFGKLKNHAAHTVEVALFDFVDLRDKSVIIKNCGAFLIRENIKKLGVDTKNLLKNKIFWY